MGRWVWLLSCIAATVTAEPVRRIDAIRPLFIETPLARDGVPAVIAADDPALKEVAERIAASVRAKFGLDLPVRDDVTADVLRERDVIALGNTDNNRVIKRLYGMRLCYLDALYPGIAEPPGGFDHTRDGITPSGWSYSTPTGPTHALRLDQQAPHSAPYAVRIDGHVEGQGRGCVLRDLPALTAGNTYRIAVWYRGQFSGNAHGTLHTDCYRGQERLVIASVDLEPSDTWREASVELTVPEGTTQSRCLLYLHGQGTIWYDDVRVFDSEGNDLLAGTPGSVVHTVHNPLGTGHNVIVAGGSDQAGHLAAAAALLETIEALSEPVLLRLLRVRLGDSAVSWGLAPPGQSDADRENYRLRVRKTLATNAFVPVRDVIQGTLTWAQRYQLSGDERHALTYKMLWEEILSSEAGWTHREMEWVFRAIEGWDLIEEAPVFSDAERLAITQRLLDIGCANEEVYGPNVQRSAAVIADGHQLDQALCLYIHGLYFDRYYGINGHWKTMAEPLIAVAEQSPRVHDSYAYGPIIGDDFMTEYALKTGNDGYFEGGACRDLAEWIMLCSDNLGAGGTFGDDGAWRGTVRLTLLAKAWGFYGDPRYLWFLRGLRPPVGSFATSRPPKPPTDLLGVARIPLHERLYRAASTVTVDPPLKAEWTPQTVPPERAFDKLAFRSGFDPGDQYLLLDGLSVIPHGHRDGGSILRFTDNGRLFLTEGHYIEIAPERHNTLVVRRDGEAWSPPPLAALELHASLPRSGFASIVSKPYNGVEWRRSLLWAPERFFVIVDTVTALRPGDYDFTLHWQTLGDASLKDGILTVDQNGERFSIQNVDGAFCTVVEEEHRLGGNYYASYPHSRDGLVKHLQQTRRAALEPGQTVTFVNVLLTHQDPDPPLRAVFVGEHAIRLDGFGGPWLAAWGPQTVALGEVDADLALAGPQIVAVAGARSIDAGMAKIHCSPAVHAEVDLTSGLGTLIALAPTEAEVVMPDGGRMTLPFEPGTQQLPTPLSQDPTPYLNALPTVPVEPVAPPAPPPDEGLTEVRSVVLPRAPRNWAAEPSARISSTVPPLAESTWVPDWKISLDDLLHRREAIVLWEAEQAPVLTVDLGAVRPVSAVVLRTMWTDNSARGLRYRFGSATVETAADPAGPYEPLGELAEAGEPELGSRPVYRLDGPGRDVRMIRFTLRPAPGAGLFLSGIEALGPADEPVGAPGVVPWASNVASALAVADLDRDGVDELLIGTRTGELLALSAEGAERWRTDLAAPVACLAAGDLDGDGRPEVVAGTDGQTLVCLGADGAERWRREFDEFWGRRGDVRTVLVVDLDGDGRTEVVAGTQSWHYWCFDADGRERWRHEVLHGATHASAADLDGDGRIEILAGHEYYGPRCLGADGQTRFSVYGSGPWCTRTAVWDADHNGAPDGVWALQDNTLHVRGGKGEALCDVNVGGFVTDLLTTDLDGDGFDELLAGVDSSDHNLVALEQGGARRWSADLPAAVSCLAALPGRRVAAGCRDGRVVVVDAGGQVVAARRLEAPVAQLAAVGGTDLLAVSAGGRLALLRPE